MTLTRGCTGSGLQAPDDQERPGGLGHRLSWAERIEIMRGRDQGLSYAEIARRIDRDKAVVWREVDRNQNPDGDYHAGMAHSRAGQRARRPKQFKLSDPAIVQGHHQLDGSGLEPAADC